MNFLVRFKVLLLIVLHWISNIIRCWISQNKKKSVPSNDDPILKLSATSLAQRIRERKVFSQEIVQIYIRRINQVNPIINAVVEDRFDAALEDARQIDRYLDEHPDKIDELKVTKPFFGVPFTIKESIALKGLSYTGCSLIRKNVKADKDSVVVKRLKEAGVIPLLVSNTSEYCTYSETFNKIIGYTYNPYNTLYNSGGSSGGEGALLGAGASVIGIGSDAAGCIRISALFNGIFGHKPTKQIVSLEGHWPNSDEDIFQNSLVIGPMVRYAEDLKPLLKIISGPNVDKLKLDEEVDLSKVQVFYMEDCGNNFCLPAIGKEIKTAIKTAAAYLSKECHCHISNHKFKELADSIEIVSADLMRLKHFPSPLKDIKTKYNVFVELLKELFGKSIFTMQHLLFYFSYIVNKLTTYNSKKYIQKKEELKKMLEDVLGNNGILLYPCNSSGAFEVGDHLILLTSASYVSIPNLLGFPATSVPTGFDSKKMPIGIQVIAGPNQDKLTLAVAQELEKCFGGWQERP